MPELPEIETIRGQLEKYLKGHKVIGVEAHYKNFEGDGKDLVGGKVVKVRRFGKVTVIDLDNGYSIVAHIKMTGQFVYRGPNLLSKGRLVSGRKFFPPLSPKVIGGVPGKHTHATFKLDKNGTLYYNDVRRFGWIKIVNTKDVENISFIKKLGPEPKVAPGPSVQATLSLELFRNILSKTSRPVKIVLMDQEKIGGVGNIYANDALWLARVNPRSPAKNLRTEEIKILYKAMLKVLKEGIKYGGASEQAYVTPDGKEGSYQKHSLAYGREGEPCERCHKGKFIKYFLGGRGTYVCPNCQK